MGQRAKLSPSRGRPFDWLKDLDQRGCRLPRAVHISDYPLFYFARYPSLRPHTIRRKPLDEALKEAGYEYYGQLLSECEKKVESRCGRAAENLTSGQRIQLFALLIDIQDEIQRFKSRRRDTDRFGTLAREGPALQKQLPRNLSAARRSLLLLVGRSRRYELLDPPTGRKYRVAASAALDQLRNLPKLEKRSFDGFATISRELRPVTKGSITYAMVRLYWFFHSGCGLRRDEAEVRVALLRNGLWKSDVDEVDFSLGDDSDLPKGCRAVYVAVSRYHLSKNTSR
ncbi:MAG TPA: hypothetical protein VK709_12250 [Candidatus Saccharimonadales bacterium]|nr:hypothetical protein [Candidatus Saccharimonadales bacterium]